VTTASDEQGRATVYDYIGQDRDRLAPVGRLDKPARVLLLLTNDSEWAARVLNPTSHIARNITCKIAALGDEPLLNALRAGVREGDDFLRVERVRELRRGERNAWLEIVLKEGKKPANPAYVGSCSGIPTYCGWMRVQTQMRLRFQHTPDLPVLAFLQHNLQPRITFPSA